MTLELDTTLECGDIALQEQLDGKDPLRHLRDNGDLEGVISSEGLARASSSISELLTVLPQQSHSVEDGLLKLTFAHNWESIPKPLSISLVVDASPGCGGLAWPAGQVLLHSLPFIVISFLNLINPLLTVTDSRELSCSERPGISGEQECSRAWQWDWARWTCYWRICDQCLDNRPSVRCFSSFYALSGFRINSLLLLSINPFSPLLPIMHRNVLLNKLEERVHVAELNWSVFFYLSS